MLEGRTIEFQSEVMNNDDETSITFVDEQKVEKFKQFLPAGQTGKGFRQHPLIQFYSDYAKGGYYTLRTVRPDQVTRVKGLSDAQIKNIAAGARVKAVIHEAENPKPKKTRRRKLLNK